MVAVVGRPNVGKSALFNRLAGKNIAIVHDRPGVTRDRLVAVCKRGKAPFEIIDTGGIGETINDDFYKQVQAEAEVAMGIADLILFVVDGFTGTTPVDLNLAKTLRKKAKKIVLVVNKMDSEKRQQHGAEFSRLGFDSTVFVSAAHGIGIDSLLQTIHEKLELQEVPKAERQKHSPKKEVEDLNDDDDEESDEESGEEKPDPRAGQALKIAIVGRPNAGKSSLINAILGEDRTIVSDVAGTTRDSIDIPYEYRGQKYKLIDTAGLRRKAKIHDAVESFSAMATTRTLKRADLCILMLDATDMTMQDRKIAQLIVEQQRPCIILLNKFDLYHPENDLKERLKELEEKARREFFFLPYAPMVAISAKEKQFLNKIFSTVQEVVKGAQNPPNTGALNRILHGVVDNSPAALGRSGRSFKLLYASLLKEDKPSLVPVPHIVMFANRADQLQDSFLRHLESVIRKTWPAKGLPFRWSIRGKKGKDKPTA